jgi:hypothetical protein
MLYVFVKTRNGATPALVSSLLTAFVAIALVCYQRAPTPFWVAGMFLSFFCMLGAIS